MSISKTPIAKLQSLFFSDNCFRVSSFFPNFVMEFNLDMVVKGNYYSTK